MASPSSWGFQRSVTYFCLALIDMLTDSLFLHLIMNREITWSDPDHCTCFLTTYHRG